MPRYFFHVADDEHSYDNEGSEFSDDDAAIKEAMLAGTEMIREFGRSSVVGHIWEMLVQDGDGRTVFALNLKGTVLTGAAADVPHRGTLGRLGQELSDVRYA